MIWVIDRRWGSHDPSGLWKPCLLLPVFAFLFFMYILEEQRNLQGKPFQVNEIVAHKITGKRGLVTTRWRGGGIVMFAGPGGSREKLVCYENELCYPKPSSADSSVGGAK